MKLEQIYERLRLFPLYLEYRINSHGNQGSPERTMADFKAFGYLPINKPVFPPFYRNFNEWLFENQFYDCVDNWEEVIPISSEVRIKQFHDYTNYLKDKMYEAIGIPSDLIGSAMLNNRLF